MSRPAFQGREGLRINPRTWVFVVFGAFALAILVAIWSLPGFFVQDGPLHLYNAHLIRELLRADSPWHEHFVLDPRPLPYWGAYALLNALMPALGPRVADQVLMTLTSVGLATVMMWLRWRIAGWQGAAILAPLVVVLSINVLWMYGLYSFLLGAALFLITLDYWWRHREGMGARQAALLAVLLIAGYFCHLVSFGSAMIGLAVLALFTPGPDFRRRLKWTAVSLIPSVPLVVFYVHAMGSGGESNLDWKGLADPWSPGAWLTYLFLADLSRIHRWSVQGSGASFVDVLFSLPPPSRWALIGLCLMMAGAVVRRSEQDRAFYRLHRAWIVVAAGLLAAGAVGPSDVGSTQGFLRERLLLLGFATCVPLLRVKRNHVFTGGGIVLATFAAVTQVFMFWDYALGADRRVRAFMQASTHVGTNRRVAAIVISRDWRYRTDPLIHAPNLLGLYGQNLVWNNHAPALFYFPIKYRSAEAREVSLRISAWLRRDFVIAQKDAAAAPEVYRAIMERSHASVDVLVLWSWPPELSAISGQWFESRPLYEDERLKVLRHLPY